ncbi:MAG: glycosyl transferase [Bacteroidetes bacterium]|nr:MAG: glycosyl transferase [Bacteroidota bacterium]
MKNQTSNIAYFILVHRFPQQFKRLFKAIYHASNHYLVHIDQKAGETIHAEIQSFLADFPHTYLLKSENVLWGGYSMVQAELNGIKFLLDKKIQWDFFINLSGQDFPLMPQEEIQDFLSRNAGKNYIKVLNQAVERPETMNRIEHYFEETLDGYVGKPIKRSYMQNTVSYIGGQWMILTRACCEFICNSHEVQKFEDFYLHTFIADEGFFQTVLMNTSFGGKLINDDKRAIIWVADGDIKLRPKTFTEDDLGFLLTGGNLFARKFDEVAHPKIMDLLEARMEAMVEA